MGKDDVTVRERLERARPTVDSPTYRLLKGEITRAQYEALINEQRKRHGLPAIKRQVASG